MIAWMNAPAGLSIVSELGDRRLDDLCSWTKSMTCSITISLRFDQLLLDLLPRRRRALVDQRDDDVEAGLQRLDRGLADRLDQLGADVRPR